MQHFCSKSFQTPPGIDVILPNGHTIPQLHPCLNKIALHQRFFLMGKRPTTPILLSRVDIVQVETLMKEVFFLTYSLTLL